MTWWLLHSKRLEAEKAALADLEGSVDWLQVIKWYANTDIAMCVGFQIAHSDEVFSFEMIYPSIFPDAPPMIYTEDRSRISRHQYGADGELCLEHRPDNWSQSITGAEMVASCQRLLSEERVITGEVLHAHSAHSASLGRDLRSKFTRFLISEQDIEALNCLSELTPEPLELYQRTILETFIISIHHLGTKDAPIWTSDLVMPKGGSEYSGFAVRISGSDAQGIKNSEDLSTLLMENNLQELHKLLFSSDTPAYCLIGNQKGWHLCWLYGEPEKREIILYTTVYVPADEQRLPYSFEDLSKKKVGIVGCGSLGSKIAASLCRSGVRRFLLIDEDILFPGNVVRNELDLSAVGVHKSHGLRNRLLAIAPKADVKALRLSLGGQESAESMSGALEALGYCDLLVDATADPNAFNMIASASTRNRTPMVWAQVFAGGIGGFVVRARPDIDPIPLSARAQIENWCNDQGVEWVRAEGAGRYDGRADDGQPLIADDAEVSVIASHITRFATDLLVRPDTSIFPSSAYMIGLSSHWLFEQPFDTRPIDLMPMGVWGENADHIEPDDMLKLLRDHLPSKGEADAATDAE